jgi:hypothetical protein
MKDNNWLKEPPKKKKNKKDNILEDGLKIGLGLAALGIGLHALHDLAD